jgi:hypothetical protein
MIWLPLFVLNALVMLFCYITNPIVCLFCDEEGELHGFLNYWQTWDDSCNPRFFIVEKVPAFLRYDYDHHYEEWWGTTPELEQYGRSRCFACIKDPNFSLKERIQRYICRVLWLTRNCGYGFSFYWFGRWAFSDCAVEHEHRKDDRHYIRWGWDDSQPIWTRTWWVKIDWYWSEHWHTEGYLGWKISTPFEGGQYSMIAHRFVPIKYHREG